MRWQLARGGTDDWIDAVVPGTVGDVRGGDDLDQHDWVFRTEFEAEAAGAAWLHAGGIATYADVALNGDVVLTTTSMFLAHDVPVELRKGTNELTITCRALAPLLAQPRKPRARWRTRLADNALRWHRTMLLGRMPGLAPSPAAVGPWRPVEIRREPPPPRVTLLPRVEGDDGVLLARSDRVVEVEFEGETVTVEGEAELRVANVRRWWPHTHGAPELYDVRVGDEVRRVGFRTLEIGDPFAIVVNDVPVFARGAVWTPVAGATRRTLELARDAGMNIVRVVGTAAYEDAAFHDACDELGLLVWQDFMFASMDYPVADPEFRALVEAEARQALATVAGRPSLAVLCGNSEVEQQVAMLGLDPALGRGELFGELLPALAEELCPGVRYVPSAPSGGAMPFRPGEGVAHWFGVSGYRRPLSDARLAAVRFAAECLAFSHLGDDDDPGSDEGVPADNGADWTFRDVREHYLREDGLETGEVAAEVFGEWRRAASPCAGGIVLWLRDLRPGAGWGLIDHAGRPKAALGHLRRALAPVAVWTTDEGQSGIAVHVANDTAEPLRARLRIALYANGETPVGEASEDVALGPHDAVSHDVEGKLGRFTDINWTYRFGPPAQDVVVATLEGEDGAPLSQAFRFPVGPPRERETAEALGLSATRDGDVVNLRADRVVRGVRLRGVPADDDAFCLEPGHPRRVGIGVSDGPLVVEALNLDGTVEVA
jgi:beta-mannosidase